MPNDEEFKDLILETEFIFVYGTLRRGAANSMHNELPRYAEFYTDASMQGKLFEIDDYPAAILSDSLEDKVYGELYRIIRRGKLLLLLDEYEGCNKRSPRPHEYIRKKIPVSHSNGQSTPAWVYLYNRPIKRMKQIESGDYVSFIRSGK